MTSPAPQKEYIITEKQLKYMVENGTVGYSPYRDGVADVVRSRPYIPTTSAEQVLEPTDKDIAQSALYQCLRPEIRKMAHRMEQKFRLNDEERGDPFKEFNGWRQFIALRLEEERIELEKAIKEKRPPSEVWNEAGDVCNLETMKAVNYERDYWKELRAEAQR